MSTTNTTETAETLTVKTETLRSRMKESAETLTEKTETLRSRMKESSKRSHDSICHATKLRSDMESMEKEMSSMDNAMDEVLCHPNGDRARDLVRQLVGLPVPCDEADQSV